jgi:hypothetical protein
MLVLLLTSSSSLLLFLSFLFQRSLHVRFICNVRLCVLGCLVRCCRDCVPVVYFRDRITPRTRKKSTGFILLWCFPHCLAWWCGRVCLLLSSQLGFCFLRIIFPFSSLAAVNSAVHLLLVSVRNVVVVVFLLCVVCFCFSLFIHLNLSDTISLSIITVITICIAVLVKGRIAHR